MVVYGRILVTRTGLKREGGNVRLSFYCFIICVHIAIHGYIGHDWGK